MISTARYWFLVALIILVYIAGMFVTLFENDSAQFAVMAMRMVQENDFINLFKGPNEYLDKPHMHYWSKFLEFMTGLIVFLGFWRPCWVLIAVLVWANYFTIEILADFLL